MVVVSNSDSEYRTPSNRGVATDRVGVRCGHNFRIATL